METKKKRERHSAAFKAKVAIDAIKEKETLQELSSKYKVSALTISKWKAEFLSNSALAFSGEADATKKEEAHEKQVKELQAKIGELTMERDFFISACKKAGLNQYYCYNSICNPHIHSFISLRNIHPSYPSLYAQ